MIPPRRITVMGGAGAGKSTAARAIAAALGLAVIHLDRLAFDPGWVRVDPMVFRDRVAALIDQDGWVMDGTYAEAAELALGRADLAIWLDQPTWRRLWRAWRKTRDHRGRPRPDRPDGCEEQFGWGYAWEVVRFGRWSRRLAQRLRRAAGGPVLRLRGDSGVRDFLQTLSLAQPPV